jgi:catechol 2,3-dioxygenase-like lactoylglutathione lyase family enzyme
VGAVRPAGKVILMIKNFGLLLAVNDIQVSRNFYEKILGQKVIMDLGANIAFESGFCIQADYIGIIGEADFKIAYKSNDHELVTEVEDFDEFVNHLQQFSDIVYVHGVKEYPWLQRVVRFYDPDFHIIEVGESMGSIFKKLFSQGISIEKIAKKTMHPVEYVTKFLS